MNNDQVELATQSLPFSSYLVSAKRLSFARCERSSDGRRINFIFEDPHQLGERLYMEFASGGLVSATAFFDAIRHLRKIMDQTIKSNNEQGAHNGYTSIRSSF